MHPDFTTLNIPSAEVVSAIIIACWAAYIDFRTHKIPNALTVPSAILGMLIHCIDSGLTGLLHSLAGFGLGLIFLLPGYALQTTAAGDVKLMAALGSLVGPSRVLDALIYSIFIAGIVGMAMALAAWRISGATSPYRRYWQMLYCLIGTGRFIYIHPRAGEAMAQRMPLAVPIAAGTVMSILYPFDLIS